MGRTSGTPKKVGTPRTPKVTGSTSKPPEPEKSPKLHMTFSSDDENDMIQDIEKLKHFRPTLVDIPEEDAEAHAMLGKYAKTSNLIGGRLHDAQNFGFQTPKKANQMLERTAQILQNSASKVVAASPSTSRCATPSRCLTPSSAKKNGRTSANVTPLKISLKMTPSKGPSTPMSMRKALINTPLRVLQLSGDGPQTPHTTRNAVKRNLAKLKEVTEADDSSESDSDEDEEDSSDSENEAQPVKKVPTSAKKETPSTAASGQSRKRVGMKENSENYFQAHGDVKILTSDKTLSQLKTPRLSQEALRHMLSGEQLRFQPEIDKLLEDYRKLFKKWMLLLKENFNLLLFGLGSKRGLINDFHSEILASENCVVVNGFFPSLTLKQILNGITNDILETDITFTTPSEQADFITKNLQDSLYLIVHNLDGGMLRGDKNQSVLARLASHPKIHLICSIDHINAPLMWDQQKLSQFNFVWFDCTTFLPYTEETLNENSLMVKQSGTLALNSLTRVFASLTPNAKGIYLIIVRHQMEGVVESGIQFYPGISFKDLYRLCRKAFLINADLTLRAQLTEFRDHKLIKSRKGSDGLEYLTIPLENSTLQEFIDQQSPTDKN